jgi:hypothetical protein
MRWDVEGADTTTGKDVRLTVEAVTREEAERLARYNGILVAAITRPAAAPPIDYQPPPQPIATALAPPEYPDLVFAARWLRRLSYTAAAFGVIYSGAAVLVVLLALLQRPLGGMLDMLFGLLLGSPPSVLAIALSALACFITAAVLRLLAGLAVARRDLARNSFSR